MTTATAPTPTEAAPAGVEPSAGAAAETAAPNAEPTTDAKGAEPGNTLLTKEPVKESPTPAELALALPKDSPLDAAVLTRITDLAREAGVTDGEKAQAFVDLLHGEVVGTIEATRTAFTKGGAEWTALVQKMEAEALADPDLGAGDTAKLTQAVTEAKAVVGKYAPKGFDAYLDESGLGSDPRFLKFARAVYAGMREDRFVEGAPPAPKPKSPAQRMYPNHPSAEG